jgi:TIGR01777 family protein
MGLSMSFTASHVLPFDREFVWGWHTRKGAAARLIPPFFPMHPVKEAKRLSDGTTTYSLPAGLRWVSRHDLSAYRRGHRFSEVCVSSPIRSIADWRHTHSFADVEGGTLITDDIHTRAPSGPLKSFLAYRQHQLLGDLSFLYRIAALVDAPPLTVGVTGSRSLIGRAVTAQLRTAGHTVVQIVREKMRPGRRLWEPFHPAKDLLDGIDVVVHLAGEPMLGRFNEDHKKAIRDSRIVPTRKLAELAASSPQCTAFICASAIGLYGPHTGEAAVTETSEPGEGFLAEVTQEWEAACAPAVEAGKRVVNIRTGVVLSGRGGVLPIKRVLFSTGLGGNVGGGSQWVSWISLDDLSDIYVRAVVDPTLSGPINAVAPNPVQNRDITKALSKQLNRPALMPIPSLGPKLLRGKEGAAEISLADQRVSPAVLSSKEHVFRFPTVEEALAHELGGDDLLPDPTKH